MRHLLLALLLVSLVPAAGWARGRHCHSSGCGGYRGVRVSYAPVYRYRGYSPRYLYSSTGRGGYYSIFHDYHPRPRVIPQPSAPSVYPPGQYPTLIHSPGVEYVNQQLAPAVGGPPESSSNP